MSGDPNIAIGELAVIQLLQKCQATKQRRLATARGTNHRHDLTRLHGKRDIAQYLVGAERLAAMLQCYNGICILGHAELLMMGQIAQGESIVSLVG